jgi:CTP synthase (UTP-ammonia lyase)
MVIGILGRPLKVEDFDRIIYSKAIIDVILRYNVIPLGIIPPNIDVNKKLNKKEKQKLYKIIDLCDGIILQGGSNCYNYDIEAIAYINNKDIPVLGICLGMQSMAITSNGKLTNIEGHKDISMNYVHKVKLKKDSILYQIYKKEYIMVNSNHQSKVLNSGNYIISGYDLEGNIEAIEFPNKTFSIGLQWHPEYMFDYDKDTKRLFDYFFNIIKNKK